MDCFFNSDYAIILSTNDYRSHAFWPASFLFLGFVSDVKDPYMNTVIPLWHPINLKTCIHLRTKYWIALLTLISGRTVSRMSSIAFNAP